MGEKGVVGRGVGGMKQRKTCRGVARRDVVDVVLSPPRIDLAVPSDGDLAGPSPIVLLDATSIPDEEEDREVIIPFF
jgi:hypothetical protein